MVQESRKHFTCCLRLPPLPLKCCLTLLFLVSTGIASSSGFQKRSRSRRTHSSRICKATQVLYAVSSSTGTASRRDSEERSKSQESLLWSTEKFVIPQLTTLKL